MCVIARNVFVPALYYLNKVLYWPFPNLGLDTAELFSTGRILLPPQKSKKGPKNG
jgi:hypothetical protein